MLNILVTGGLGFIGQHLLRYLEPKRHHLVAVDALINHSLSPEAARAMGVEVHTCLCSEFSLEGRHFDRVYHLASPVGPAGVLKWAGQMGEMIIHDTFVLAKYCQREGCPLLVISTSEVYGKNPFNVRQKEACDKIVPPEYTIRLEYGVAKLLSEIMTANMARVGDLIYNVIRPFNIAGPGQRGEVGFVIPRFVEAALAGKPLEVFGDGTQVRSFTHVQDIVEALVMVMESSRRGEIYNVGNPANTLSIKALAARIVELTGSRSPIVLVDPTTIYGPHYAEAWNKIPDITKIQQHFGWECRFTVDDIIRDVVRSLG